MKAFGRNVIYISQKMASIDTSQDKFFPFLNSQLINSSAINQFAVKGLHAMCSLDNIRSYVPHKGDVQEFVFFGRSNVGKSSLINTLIRKDFVETSKKPGKTKELAFLKINSPLTTFLVDAPGYGYASDASKRDISQWGRLIEYYLKNTPKDDSQIILLLLDIKHGLKETDVMLLKLLKSLSKNFLIIYTKCDRASEKDMEDAVKTSK
jgi:GTP-binding protein